MSFISSPLPFGSLQSYPEGHHQPITIYARPPTDTAATSTRRSFTSSSPMGGAADAMKKFLRRRRGTTSDGFNNTSPTDSSPRSPLPQAFEIVGGYGAISPGTTVYDIVDPISSSPRNISSAKMASIDLATTTPTSPKSPTFHGMFARFGRDRTAGTKPQVFGSLSELSSSPPALAPSSSSTNANDSSISGNTNSNTNSNTYCNTVGKTKSERKKIFRRSLSMDGLFICKDIGEGAAGPVSTNVNVIAADAKIHPWSLEGSEQVVQGPLSPPPTPDSYCAQSDLALPHDLLLESDPDFLHSTVEFLNTHHSRSSTIDCWANRNRRRTSGPSRRQSESGLLNIIGENNNVDDEDQQCNGWSSNLGAGGSSESLQLSNCLSSPTQYYDCPQARNVLRFYLANNEYQFDEMLESGFPSKTLRGMTDETAVDGLSPNFMTLRLTLTPWHARAEESKLYGPENTAKPPHLRSMMYKLFSRSSSSLLLLSPTSQSHSQPQTRSSSTSGPSSAHPESHVSKDSISTIHGDQDAYEHRHANTTTVVDDTPYEASSTAHTGAKKGSPRGPSKEHGFKITAPVELRHQHQHQYHGQRENNQYLSSPPLTPVQKRCGSLSALSLPLNALCDDTLTPPGLPPRRKTSTPALFYSSNAGHSNNNASTMSLPETIERPRSTLPVKSGLRRLQMMSPSQQQSVEDEIAATSMSLSPRVHSSPVPSNMHPRQQQPFAKTSFETTRTLGGSAFQHGPRYPSPPMSPPSPTTRPSTGSIQSVQQDGYAFDAFSFSRNHATERVHRTVSNVASMHPSAFTPWRGEDGVKLSPSYSTDFQMTTMTPTTANTDMQRLYYQNHFNLQQQQQQYWQQNQMKSQSHQNRQQQQQLPPLPPHLFTPHPPASPARSHPRYRFKNPLSPTESEGQVGMTTRRPSTQGSPFPSMPLDRTAAASTVLQVSHKRNKSEANQFSSSVGSHFNDEEDDDSDIDGYDDRNEQQAWL
ncbi:hypothetical protein BGZ94_003892 [Podila epigama]|nr:hypothetical protein BGZ94_003892 [Podila epigama]